jgi:hypothetical protein
LDDRFSAADLTLALARPGHEQTVDAESETRRSSSQIQFKSHLGAGYSAGAGDSHFEQAVAKAAGTLVIVEQRCGSVGCLNRRMPGSTARRSSGSLVGHRG